ncbi:MAG: BON domain-containing protein [Planctomycetaceae bacterium]
MHSAQVPALAAGPVSKADDQLQQHVRQALRASGYRVLASLECRVWNGVVVLQGSVPTFHLKQVAQNAARRLPGVRQIHNDVRVG